MKPSRTFTGGFLSFILSLRQCPLDQGQVFLREGKLAQSSDACITHLGDRLAGDVDEFLVTQAIRELSELGLDEDQAEGILEDLRSLVDRYQFMKAVRELEMKQQKMQRKQKQNETKKQLQDSLLKRKDRKDIPQLSKVVNPDGDGDGATVSTTTNAPTHLPT